MPAARTTAIREKTPLREIGGRIRGLERQAGGFPAQSAAGRPQSKPTARALLALGDIELDVSKRRLWRSGLEIKLPKRGFSMLVCFMSKPRHVFSRAQLRDFVWGRNADIDDRTVDVQVGRLRKALGAADRSSPIRTARGAGYFIIAAASRPSATRAAG